MNHNRSTALERSVKKLLGGLNRFYGHPTSPSASIVAQNTQPPGPRGGSPSHQWTITWNKQTTDKHRDEAKMRTRQKRVATDTRRSPRCRTTPPEHRSKRKPTVEPRWAKQQTKKAKLIYKVNLNWILKTGPLFTSDVTDLQSMKAHLFRSFGCDL